MSSTRFINDKIIDAIKKGDKESFEYVFKHYYKKLFYFAYQHSHDKFIAEEIVQQTFITIYSSIKSLKRNDYFEKWLYRICVIESANYYRSKKKDNLVLSYSENTVNNIEDKEPTIQDKINFDELKEFLSREINKMEEKDACIAKMKYFHSYKNKEIAKKMNIPIGTVKSSSNRIKNKLEKKLRKFNYVP